jgi:hypothetical protein
LTADVISKAKAMADQQEFEKARELVQQASKIIQESFSGAEPFCKVSFVIFSPNPKVPSS